MPKPNDDLWPLDPRTGRPRPPMAQPGYYPGWHSLSQEAFWDEATRKVVLDRVRNVPPLRFFLGPDAALMSAICDRLMPQDDRDDAHKIPILHYIDHAVFEDHIPGYRYADTPPPQEVHRLGLQGVEAIAHHLYGVSFVALGPLALDEVLTSIHDDTPPAGQDVWAIVPPKRYWSHVIDAVIEAYYAHPYAWDEIGFGGPSYPRGYMRLEHGEPEPFEKREKRYEWVHPPTTLSGVPDLDYASPTHPGVDVKTGGGGTH